MSSDVTPSKTSEGDDYPPPAKTSWFRKNIWVPLVATCSVPPYNMLMWFIPFSTILTMSKSIWLKSAMSLYWAYCIFDTSPQALKKTERMRKMQAFCNRMYWVHNTTEYFPVKLVKTGDIPADQSYIFAYHPHGVIAMGSACALASNGCNFEATFPGIDRSAVALNATFWAPIYRHWMLGMGCCSPNKDTMKSRLEDGDSLVLVPGGAVEALHAHPKVSKLCLLNRKGFIKLALETKAKVVPTYGFGENDVFDTVYLGKEESSNTPHTWIWEFQHRFKQVMSFSAPMWFHIMPRRVPIHVVVGAPVEFPEGASVDECHDLYCKALRELYDEHKAKYGYEDVPLELL